MKMLVRYLAVGLIAGVLAVSTSFAGECCKKTMEKTRMGKMCSKCMKADAPECCKKACEMAMKDKDAKPCGKCMKEEKK